MLLKGRTSECTSAARTLKPLSRLNEVARPCVCVYVLVLFLGGFPGNPDNRLRRIQVLG